MISFTCSDHDEAVALANRLLRDEGLDCAVYTPASDPECFMVLDDRGAAHAAAQGDELLLDHNPERRRFVRVPFREIVRVTPIETAHA